MSRTNHLPSLPFYVIPNLALPSRRRSSNQATTTLRSRITSSTPLPTSTTEGTSTSQTSKSSPQPTGYLPIPPSAYIRCSTCLSHFVPATSIISKAFNGRHGRAYLVCPPSPEDVCGLFRPKPTSSSKFANPRISTSPFSSEANDALYKGNLPQVDFPEGEIFDVNLRDGDLPNTVQHKPIERQLVTGKHLVADVACKQCGKVVGWKYIDAEYDEQKYKIGMYILETQRVVQGSGWEDAPFTGDVLAENPPTPPLSDSPSSALASKSASGSPSYSSSSTTSPSQDISSLGAYISGLRIGLAARMHPYPRPSNPSFITCPPKPQQHSSQDQRRDSAHTNAPPLIPEYDDIEFDSEDEEECEDLFAGIWTPALARQRRREKAGMPMQGSSAATS